MPVGTLSEDDFYRALDEVVGSEDEVLAVFSGLYTFSHRFRWAAQETPTRLLDVFEGFMGDRRTFVFPAYYFGFGGSRKFDLERTKTDIGVLPDCAVDRQGFFRLAKPINSYMVKGPRSSAFLSLPCRTAWGEDGVLAWLAQLDAKILILGVPWHEACSLYHYAEELLKVPYRLSTAEQNQSKRRSKTLPL
jgi:aminoglycoside N3'-acetyltransferase